MHKKYLKAIVQEDHNICTGEWQMLSAKANTVQRPVETGPKIQYSAPLRRVAKDQDCSAPYVGEDFTEYQRAIEAILKANTV